MVLQDENGSSWSFLLLLVRNIPGSGQMSASRQTVDVSHQARQGQARENSQQRKAKACLVTECRYKQVVPLVSVPEV